MDHSMSGIVRLSHDFAKLVNDSEGSDVKFLVGKSEVLLHGHSTILRVRSRYFSNLLSDNKEWKEKKEGVIRKPNVSPVIFTAILHYLYTGRHDTIDVAYIVELIAAAEEMELDKLSVECQSGVIGVLVSSIGEEESSVDEDDLLKTTEKSYFKPLPVDVAISSLLLPALIVAEQHCMSYFYQRLLRFAVKYINIVIKSPDIRITFLQDIPLKIFKQILASDSLTLEEFDIWDLALEWACINEEVTKIDVELQLKKNLVGEVGDDDGFDLHDIDNKAEEVTDETLSNEKLSKVKDTLNPLLPAIRFTLIDVEKYSRVIEMFSFFLPKRQALKVQRFFSFPSGDMPKDKPRVIDGGFGSEIVNRALKKTLKERIFDTKLIKGCSSSPELRFNLLHRASKDGFAASDFHRNCDNKGPTIVLIKSSDGHIFGGVNFAHWNSSNNWSSGAGGFVFSLEDGKHRKANTFFLNANSTYSTMNNASTGPQFGNDLCIVNNPNVNNCTSGLPQHYTGANASNTFLAGAAQFKVADYEVFAILEK